MKTTENEASIYTRLQSAQSLKCERVPIVWPEMQFKAAGYSGFYSRLRLRLWTCRHHSQALGQWLHLLTWEHIVIPETHTDDGSLYQGQHATSVN
jgi:hypothetical protein